MPVKGCSVRVEKRYYGRSKYSMHAVYGRYQAVATRHNTMPLEDILQRILLDEMIYSACTTYNMRVVWTDVSKINIFLLSHDGSLEAFNGYFWESIFK